MKTKQELENIKERLEKLNAELHELTDEELEQVTGGVIESKIKYENEAGLEGKAFVVGGGFLTEDEVKLTAIAGVNPQ